MFQVYRMKAIFVLLLFNLITENTKADYVSESGRCEDVSYFLRSLEVVSPVTAYKLISAPLNCPACPFEVRKLQQKLFQFVTNSLVNMKAITQRLRTLSIANKYDALISTLMIINEMPHLHPLHKREISQTIMFLLKKKYLNKNSWSGLSHGFCTFDYDLPPPTTRPMVSPQAVGSFGSYNLPPPTTRPMVSPQVVGSFGSYNLPPPTTRPMVSPQVVGSFGSSGRLMPKGPFINPPNQDVTSIRGCGCQMQLVDLLLKRLLERERSCAKIEHQDEEILKPDSTRNINGLFPPYKLVPITTGSNPSISWKPPVVPVKSIIDVIPKPQSQMEQDMYKKLQNFLESKQVQEIINQLKFPKDMSKSQIMDTIITTVLHTIHTQEVKEVFTFYQTYKEAKNINFVVGSLMEAVPLPESSKQKEAYEFLKMLLNSKEIYKFIDSNLINQKSTSPEKLLQILTSLYNNETFQKELTPQNKLFLEYYIALFNAKEVKIDFSKMMQFLGQPTTENEKKYFDIIQKLINSNDVYFIMNDINVFKLPENQQFRYFLQRLNRLQTPNSYQLFSPNELADILNALNFYKSVWANKHYGFNVYNLFPQKKFQQDKLPQVIHLENYFLTEEFQKILSQLQLSSLTTEEQTLTILKTIIERSTDVKTVEYAKTLLTHIETEMFYKKLKEIIAFIPSPQNDKESAYYYIVTNFLNSQEAYKLLNSIDFSLFPSNKHLLEFIYNTILQSNLESKVKEAFKFYMDLSENLEPLVFVTKKEIKKNFKLTEIFTDTLDLKLLNLDQKEAFTKFFKYISEIRPDALAKFDSWDQAKTRGEFMKLLFKYLVDSSTILPEIKESILVLDPLVKMDGKAALPP